MTDKEHKAFQRMKVKVRKRIERKRMAKVFIEVIQAKITAWWRTKVTRRCCRTCEHWTPLAHLDGLVGRCQVRRISNPSTKRPQSLITNYMTICKTWRKNSH